MKPKCLLNSDYCFWSLTASKTMDIKNNHPTYLQMPIILNKLIEVTYLITIKSARIHKQKCRNPHENWAMTTLLHAIE